MSEYYSFIHERKGMRDMRDMRSEILEMRLWDNEAMLFEVG